MKQNKQQNMLLIDYSVKLIFALKIVIKIVDEKKYKNFQALIILPWNISSFLIKKFVKKSKRPYISVQNIVKKLKK